jgi:hypothetical protein
MELKFIRNLNQFLINMTQFTVGDIAFNYFKYFLESHDIIFINDVGICNDNYVNIDYYDKIFLNSHVELGYNHDQIDNLMELYDNTYPFDKMYNSHNCNYCHIYNHESSNSFCNIKEQTNIIRYTILVELNLLIDEIFYNENDNNNYYDLLYFVKNLKTNEKYDNMPEFNMIFNYCISSILKFSNNYIKLTEIGNNLTISLEGDSMVMISNMITFLNPVENPILICTRNSENMLDVALENKDNIIKILNDNFDLKIN